MALRLGPMLAMLAGRYYAPDRDMQLVRKIVPKPFTWAELLRTTGYDGSQSFEEVRARLWCTSGVPKREE